MTSRLAVLIMLICFITATRARAGEDVDGARAQFEAGRRAYDLGEFDTAAKAYREAYRLHPDPALLYDAAQSYRLAGNSAQALFFYRSFLRNAPDSPQRPEVEQRIAALANEVGRPPRAQQAQPTHVDLQYHAPPTTPTGRPPTAHARPAYKHWWVWTIVGVAAAGAAVGIGLGVTATENRTLPSVSL